jgi:hypothetical protein
MNENEDLNDAEFANLFFNGEPVKQQEEEPEVEEQEEDQHFEEDSGDDEEVDSPATEDDEDEDEEPEVEEPKGKNRKSAQERINELTAKARQEERQKIAAEQREAALLKRLEQLEAAVNKRDEKAEPEGIRDQLADGAPNPDAKDKDGNPIYELGEFDPKFIRDLTKFTIEQETKAAQEAARQEAQHRAMQEAKEELQTGWLEKLEAYEEEAPEVRQDITNLVDSFSGLDPAYGEYLASTIMASDVGPQLMHYLSQNIGEAQKIVASGPAAATLALGRLEARLIKTSTEEETSRNKRKVSEAPNPPEERARGIKGQFAVRPDTDDQSAFEREFFKKPFY